MIKIYRPTIAPEAAPILNELAGALNFITMQKGRHLGNPSPPQMIEAVAEAYRRDPDAVVTAFRALGIMGGK